MTPSAEPKPRVLLVDFSGHPFQAELSRGLATRGHEVRHAFAGGLVGPKGALKRVPEDPSSLSFVPLGSARLWRARLVGRLAVGVSFGGALRKEIRRFCPDVVIAANVPPEALSLSGFGERGRTWIWWVQDLLGAGSRNVLRRRSKLLGWAVGSFFGRVEARLAKRADRIVVIAEAFKPHIDQSLGDKITVVHNWAPVGELPLVAKSNAWATEHGLRDTFNFVYTGTLGMKHNPELLVQLARAFQFDGRVRVVVTSQGAGADYLRKRSQELSLSNLLLLPFQPYVRLPQVMGTADVLVALLEGDAGVFSVPSKVLSYLCAGRPILASMPLDNLASRILADGRLGLVVPPNDIAAFVAEARSLYATAPVDRQAMGDAAREFAEANFNIDAIVGRFEALMQTPGTRQSP